GRAGGGAEGSASAHGADGSTVPQPDARASASSKPRKAASAVGARTPAKKAAAPKGKAKGKASGKGARTEARILSIAPRTGPLSGPLFLPVAAVDLRSSPRLLGERAKRGLHGLGDVLFLLPRRYEDRRQLRRSADLVPGAFGVTVATARSFEGVPVRRGGRRTWKAILADSSGSMAAIHFFGGAWLRSRYPVDRRLVLSGEVRASFGAREMVHPEIGRAHV